MASAENKTRARIQMTESPCLKQVFAPPRTPAAERAGQPIEGSGCERQCRLAGRRRSR
jgi:hypothetical protein